MDITSSLAPKSDQKNADDFLAGPQTFTVESVTEGSTEQPVNVNLVESPGKPYKPSKSMLRVLAKVWGTEGSTWVGRRLTLYTDPTVMFGGVKLGGIKISHMSHLKTRTQVSLTVAKGKKGTHNVDPLPDLVQRDWSAEIEAADLPTLQALWAQAPPEHQPAMTTRATQLKEA